MSKSIRARLLRIEARSPEGFAFEAMTDEDLLKAFRRIIDREGGIEAVSASLKASGEDDEATLYQSLYTCQTATEFMAA
jgi:hypothetical protein